MEDSTLNAGCLQKLERRKAKAKQWAIRNREHRRQYMLRYVAANKQHRRETFRVWRIKNRERRNAYKRAWAKSHPESVRLTLQKWKRNNPEKARASILKSRIKRRDKTKAYHRIYCKSYYLKNRDSIKSKTKQYIQAHPEVARRSRLNWQRNHPESYRAHTAAGHVKRKARMRGALVGDKKVCKIIRRWKKEPQFICYYCNEQYLNSRLHIDHVIPISKGGKHSSDNICKSCDSCNLKKRNKDNSELPFLDQRLFAV